jgi:hypothetical protein
MPIALHLLMNLPGEPFTTTSLLAPRTALMNFSQKQLLK